MTAEQPTPAISPASAEASAGRWMTIRDIASDLAVSSSTVYKWSARGEPWFPRAIRLRNGDLRVRRDWYEAWLDAQENSAGAARAG